MGATRTGETETINGRTAYVYDDGSVRYADGRHARRPPWAASAITSETAPAMIERRDELARRAYDDALVAHARRHGRCATPAEGLRIAAERMLRIIDGADHDSASVQAFREFIRAAGYAGQRDGSAGGGGIRVEIGRDVAIALARMGLVRGEVVDVTPVDPEAAAERRERSGSLRSSRDISDTRESAEG